MVDISGAGFTKAIGAYANTARIGGAGEGEGAVGQTAAAPFSGPSFGDLMSGAVEKVADTQRVSEQVSAQAVLGKATPTEVLKAVTDAELTLQTFVTVRDRAIAAYQDIMRMPI